MPLHILPWLRLKNYFCFGHYRVFWVHRREDRSVPGPAGGGRAPRAEAVGGSPGFQARSAFRGSMREAPCSGSCVEGGPGLKFWRGLKVPGGAGNTGVPSWKHVLTENPHDGIPGSTGQQQWKHKRRGQRRRTEGGGRGCKSLLEGEFPQAPQL